MAKRNHKLRTILKQAGEPFKCIKRKIRWYILPREFVLTNRYKKYLGEKPNFKNPKKFTEKLQWLKIHERDPLHVICADKFLVRDFVKDTIGEEYLIPLVFHSDSPNDVKPENLPDYPFILKTNHDSSGGIIIRNPKTHNWKETRKKLQYLIKQNHFFNFGEWQYDKIERKVIAEKLLVHDNGQVPDDTKVHCFNGEPYLIGVDYDRFENHTRNMYYTDGTKAVIEWLKPQSKNTEKPKNWDLILELSRQLSKPFLYARIDFYEFNGKIYFGEITFHPSGGFVELKPKEWDLKLGKLLKLPID